MTARTIQQATEPPARRSTATAFVVISAMLVALVIRLRMTGQPWWCSCGSWVPWSFETNSLHNSQHLIDVYSASHVLHGILFFFALCLLPTVSFAWRLAIAVIVEVGWEVLENAPFIIDRYRNGTVSLGYSGDSVANSVGDVLSMMVGFAIARRIGWRWSIVFFVAVELAMLIAIRDNLTLNVLMLLWPIEALKRWQMAA